MKEKKKIWKNESPKVQRPGKQGRVPQEKQEEGEEYFIKNKLTFRPLQADLSVQALAARRPSPRHQPA